MSSLQDNLFDITRRPESHYQDMQLDCMTGLPVERDFFQLFDERAKSRNLDAWCVVVLDIEEFKLFNDWYGRETGDYILANIGLYLARHVLEDDWLCGYLGQDDFCVLMPHDEEQIQAIYSDICDIIVNFGATMSFTPAIGYVLVEKSVAPPDLLDRAKLALSKAKGDYKHHIHQFHTQVYKQASEEYRLLAEFEHALKNGEIHYVLQPQCRITSGKIVGVEALARWDKSDGTVIESDRFVQMLEKFGFITELDCFIWEQVCKDIKRWMDAGKTIVPVSVNVSRHDIYNLDVCEHFIKLSDTYGIPHSLFKIEITESAYIDDMHKVGEAVTRLRDNGFTVLMDDFGSGYSSLNVLDTLDMDVIKLDMCFIQMEEDAKRRSIRIIESVVNMAKMLNIIVITEGVETAEQAEFLHSIGCRYAQGFYFFRPMSVDFFEMLMDDPSAIDKTGFSFKRNEEFRIREMLDPNIYSDVMLNGLLGAVGIYTLHDGQVSIERYNEQFYEEVGIDEFDDRLHAVQTLVHPADRDRFIELFKHAEADELNGATDIIRFCRHDGALADFMTHIYYLNEKQGVKNFYGTVRDVTKISELREEMNMLSAVADVSVAFFADLNDELRCDVEIYGLEEHLGITHDSFQSELEDLSFFDRIEPADVREATRRIAEGAEIPNEDTLFILNVKTDSGELKSVAMKCSFSHKAKSIFKRTLAFRALP